MKKMKLNDIRKLFLDFFKSKDHLVVDSYPLVPLDDKSLLLVNSGMAPLKNYFSGVENPPHNRIATCQKCIRTGDIEIVGRTARHATFFEMLGNFSFGDYFKEEAISWSWEFVTEHLMMPRENLWITIYEDDDEAYNIWRNEIGVDEEKIVRLGKKDNFWEIGLGPCGPCSEIYFDRGKDYNCDSQDCKPGCECDRFVEFWNLVFTQFDKDEDGNYNLLPRPNIDTGMGLERVACIMQNVDSIFEVDTMVYILDKVCSMTKTEYGKDNDKDISLRIITDHIRSMVFMVGDGILPGNEGRGYVLRRLLRRAARHGKILGIDESFLFELADSVVKMYGERYGELNDKLDYIKKIIRIEEERFQETIHQGLEILGKYIENMILSKENTLRGLHAFKLYDTYGFPLDLTKEILAEKNLEVDIKGFEIEMKKQRERARKAGMGEDVKGWRGDIVTNLDKKIITEFLGYENLCNEAKVLKIVQNNNIVKSIGKGEEGIIILNKTCFYGESGGQVGDIGTIYSDNFTATVMDTRKDPSGRIYHIVEINEGALNTGDRVVATVDEDVRKAVARNHTATHILHKTLKEILGNHVQQAGSLVSPDRLRFDFTHFEALTESQVDEIERKANFEISKGHPIKVINTSFDEARERGAIALFDEKYGDHVRLVLTGDYSSELCGGTHVNNSSEIGMLLILSEAGIASGVRRIEAVTGLEAYKYIKKQQGKIRSISKLLKAPINNIINRLETYISSNKEKEREIEKLKSKLTAGIVDEILDKTKIINGTRVLIEKVDIRNIDELRKLGDDLKNRIGSGIILLASESEGKVSIIALVTKDILEKGVHAGKLVKEAAKITGGGGGGRADMAQAGGRNPEKINEALEKIEGILQGLL